MDLSWWIAVIGVPLVGAIFAVDFRIAASASRARQALHARMDIITKELADYKVQAALLFAQVEMVREVKNDVVKVLDRIDARLGAIEVDLREGHRAR